MTCVVCGCTDTNACALENERGDGMACWWAAPEPSPLCSACSPAALKAGEIGSPWKKLRGPFTPAQRYVHATKTLADLAGVNVFEVQAVGADRSAICGAVSLSDLERLAGIVEIASRARGEDLENGVTGFVAVTPSGREPILQTSANSKKGGV